MWKYMKLQNGIFLPNYLAFGKLQYNKYIKCWNLKYPTFSVQRKDKLSNDSKVSQYED